MRFLISLYRIRFMSEPALVLNQLEHFDYDNRIAGIEVNANLDDPTEVQRLFEYGHLLKSRGKIFQIHSPHGFNKLVDQTTKLEKYLSIYAQLAEALDTKLSIVVHPVESIDKEMARYETLKLITRLYSICELKGFPLLFTLENLNLNRDRLDTEGIAPIIDNTEVNFCWDIGHEVYENNCAYTLCDELADKLRNVHIHDIHESDHYPFRYNQTDYRRALEYLHSIDYRHSIVVEINTDHLLGENWTQKFMDYVSQVYLLSDTCRAISKGKRKAI